MRLTKYYKRYVPADIKGVVVDGKRLGTALYVPLRKGMGKPEAIAYTQHLFNRARRMLNSRLTDADAWEVARSICDTCEIFLKQGMSYYEEFRLLVKARAPNVPIVLQKIDRQLSV